MRVGDPFIHQLCADKDMVGGFAVVQIKVLDIQIVESGVIGKAEGGGAALRLGALYCFASRGVLPRRYFDLCVAFQLHGFGLDTLRVVPCSAFCVRNA